MTLRQFVKHFNECNQCQKWWLNLHEPKLPNIGRPPKTKRNEAIIKGYKDGLKVSQLAKIHGMNDPAVYNVLRRKAQIEYKAVQDYNWERTVKSLLKDWTEGPKDHIEVEQLAKKHEMSINMAYKLIRRAQMKEDQPPCTT